MPNQVPFPIAINIALIPEQAAYKQCIQVSEWLEEEQNSPYLLGRDGFAHLTLMQGCLADEQSYQSIVEGIDAWLKHQKAPLIQSKGFQSQQASGGLWWALERNEALDHWHRGIVNSSSPLLHQEATKEMFLCRQKLREEKEIDWVKGYREFAMMENFSPHFTLGYGSAPAHIDLMKSFKPSYLGIFWMGPYCSCYRELKLWELGGLGG